MAFHWENFKSALGAFSKTSVVYIDEEGSEIPIDCECEFQEALRLAKLNKNSLKLILYNKEKSDEKMHMGYCEPAQLTANPSEKCVDFKKKNVSPVSHSSSFKENAHGDVTPEWFSHYMKKFKKELLHELKSYIHDTVHSAVERDKKLSSTKSENGESFCEKNEISFCSAGMQSKKKKKILERDLIDLIDQRQIRLPKKLYATRSERLEMLDQKTKVLLEEKLRLLESKHQHKTKCFGATDKKTTPRKSASFLRSNIYVDLENASKFNVVVEVANDGNVPWSAPQLECFELAGLLPNENRINLPRLYPMEKYFTVLVGRASESPGLHYFKCKVVDGLEKLGPELTCWTKVESLEPPQIFPSDSVSRKDVTAQLIDYENEVISSTQKKIEENIDEIERRLQDIDLLQPSTYVETDPEKAKQTHKKSDEFQTGCDMMQDSENKNAPVQREVQFENKCLGTVTPSGICNSKIDTDKGQNEDAINLNKIKKDEETESSCDSELSIIFISEEEDNFLVVPSESFSLAESANEDKNSLDAEPSGKPIGSIEKTDSNPAKAEIKNEIRVQDEATPNENFRHSQPSPTRSRCSPFGEEISKPKKMKSKSTEYCFTAANLTQPTFTQIPGFFEGRPPRFTFTGVKCDLQNDASVPKKDALGRHIYAVNSNGCCLTVSDMLGSGESRRGLERGPPKNPRRKGPSQNLGVNILPNVLNGASNVASFAFNTAKSVINNLQSAFVTEGKTELGQPADEDKVNPSTKAMLKLYEMGFMNIQTNRQLLTKHNNDLTKVVNELVSQEENPSEESL